MLTERKDDEVAMIRIGDQFQVSKLAFQMMNFAFKMMNFAFKMVNFAFKMVNFAFKMVNYGRLFSLLSSAAARTALNRTRPILRRPRRRA